MSDTTGSANHDPQHATVTTDGREQSILAILAAEIKRPKARLAETIGLLDDGNTIPFIARYRKEVTGEMDEETLRTLSERLDYLRALENRKHEVLRLIAEQGKLTPDLEQSIRAATVLQTVEDLYRPYRPKRRTRATIATEKGLEPLADLLWGQNFPDPVDAAALQALAQDFVNTDAGVESVDDALQGASDILAERISDSAGLRATARDFLWRQGKLVSRAGDESEEQTPEARKYETYFKFEAGLKRLRSYQVLATNRGEREGFLKVSVDLPADSTVRALQGEIIRTGMGSALGQFLQSCTEDAYSRLLGPSLQREARRELTETAEEEAIKVFSANLRSLLLQAPVSGRRVLGLDPAYRTGCKLAVVDPTGKLLETGVIYPVPPRNDTRTAKETIGRLVAEYDIDIIAIGNGTASRETEAFVAENLSDWAGKGKSLSYTIVNEAGASVYSASPLAKKEFPSLDVSLRSAISIARRLQDPLAELVKIDPKAIGVGQYQHDVNQSNLAEALGAVVESCVNQVGVEVNTASPALLSYVAGIGPTLAERIVDHREVEGPFADRLALTGVKGMGPKTFQQCAGFLRVANSENRLDNTAIHPESYEIAAGVVDLLDIPASELGSAAGAETIRQKTIDYQELAARLDAGIPTMKDIVKNLSRPGRDPREDSPKPVFRTDVLDFDDLEEGMVLSGTVRNVVDFGVFVDIGVKQDGLVHISELSNDFVEHPLDVVQVGDSVQAIVINLDRERGRIGLSIKRA